MAHSHYLWRSRSLTKLFSARLRQAFGAAGPAENVTNAGLMTPGVFFAVERCLACEAVISKAPGGASRLSGRIKKARRDRKHVPKESVYYISLLITLPRGLERLMFPLVDRVSARQ